MTVEMNLRAILVSSLFVAATASAGPIRVGDLRRAVDPSPSATATTHASPAALAKEFFESHQRFWTEEPTPSLYSPTFERLLLRNSDCVSAGESCAIDWDFWSSSQDRGELRLDRIKRVTTTRVKQVVEVRHECDCGLGRASMHTARIVFVQIGRKWRVDDVQRENRSVREILSRDQNR